MSGKSVFIEKKDTTLKDILLKEALEEFLSLDETRKAMALGFMIGMKTESKGSADKEKIS